MKKSLKSILAIACLACLMPVIALTAKGDGIKIPTIWPPRTLPQTPGQNEGNPSAVEPLKDLTAIQIADSATTWLDVRKAKTYELEGTIPVSHSASNWVNAAAQPGDEATVTWAWNEDGQDSKSCTDDAPLTVTLKSLGEYEFTHTAADGSEVSTNITVVKRQLGTEAEPWIISKEGEVEVRAFMLSETELCIEGDGRTMANFGGCGPWGEKIESVYFANVSQEVSADAFAGCKGLRVVMTKGDTNALKTQLQFSGFDDSKITFINLNESQLVKFVSITNDCGRAKIRCAVYDKDAASKKYGSNVKLKLTATGKSVKHLHRAENGGIEYDDMMLWLKPDGRPKFVTMIWDAELDGVTSEVNPSDITVSGTACADATVTVGNGVFVGVVDEETKVRAWKGIPYAMQPTGANRWRAMGDPTPSDETFAAKQFGHAAIQALDPSETGGYVEQGDDCLVLNVWSAAAAADDAGTYGNRPVMVYIHGGAFLQGGGADIHYDGRNIVERHKDVVVVTINYRVGLMGYIDLKGVPGGEGFEDSQNLATLDQRQALKWVQDNITAFGGDKDNVTIFGESAGGASVAVHLTSPESAPYFRRAIQMSGALDFTMTEKAYEERQLTERLVAAVAELRFGDVAMSNRVDMTVLQSLTVGEIRKLLATPYADPLNPGYELAPDDISGVPIIGSIWNYPMCGSRGVVPVDPFKAFETNGVCNTKDYMVGSTRDECRYFTGYDGPDDPLRTYYMGFLSDRLRHSYCWVGTKENQDRLDEFIANYEGDGVRDEMDTRYPGIWKRTALEDQLLMRLPSIKMADIHARLNGKTYMYRFDKGREHAYEPWARAGHACELDYVFGNTSIVEAGPINEELADAVCGAFVNFARTGDPNGTEGKVGGTEWLRYDANDRPTMLFNNDCTTSCTNDPDKVYVDLLEPVYDAHASGRTDTDRRSKTGLEYVREPEPPTGTADEPWQVGKTAADDVIAYMNEVGKLFVEVREGEGDIRDFYALGGGLWFGAGTLEAEFDERVTGIGSNMLSTCSALMRIVMNSNVPPTLGCRALPPVAQFKQFTPYAVIYVPEVSVEAYKNAPGWSDYKDYIKAVTMPGSESNPWLVGKAAIAWTNGTDKLVVKGAGEVELMPWTEFADKITKLDKDEGVMGLGDLVATLPALTTVNGLSLDELAYMGMLGVAKAGFSAIAVDNGTAQLGVVVSTNGDLTAVTESWGKAKVEDVGLDKETGEAILTIPAPADKGFFIINPKPDVQSDTIYLPPAPRIRPRE